MSRAARAWTPYSICAAAVLAALGWVTHLSLKLERQELAAREEAQFQETLRLALWRMDSALAPLIAREAARPYFHYAPFYAEEVAWNRAIAKVQKGEVEVPSPLLAETPEFFRLHFQFEPEGRLSSPQAPVGMACEVAVTNEVATRSEISSSAGLLKEISRLTTHGDLLRLLERAAGEQPAALASTEMAAPPPAREQSAAPQASQKDMTIKEYSVRQQGASIARGSSQAAGKGDPHPRKDAVRQEGMHPVWVVPEADEPQLILARRVAMGDREVVQGVWADWPRLRSWLVEHARDLLPAAELLPAPPGGAHPVGRLLANVPAVLVPGAVPGRSAPLATPARITLLLSWGAILLAVAAVGVVLGAAVGLGERRGRFVSAVTHELRTPLTTFRLYSQMLADGMVKDGDAIKEYLSTLKSESERLCRVVENVLFYARVEENRAPSRLARLTVCDLLQRAAPQLERRARESGMALEVESGAAEEAVVDVDPQAIEQVLLNLVDNSCKYAAEAADRRLEVKASLRNGTVEVLYRDHGPGIPQADERKVFSAFHRGSRDPSRSTPGIGLGLTLARGLARQHRGDLQVARVAGDGAAFLLTLPLGS